MKECLEVRKNEYDKEMMTDDRSIKFDMISPLGFSWKVWQFLVADLGN
jgi:hypothetical protein